MFKQKREREKRRTREYILTLFTHSTFYHKTLTKTYLKSSFSKVFLKDFDEDKKNGLKGSKNYTPPSCTDMHACVLILLKHVREK